MPSCLCGGQNPSCARCGGSGSGRGGRMMMTTDSRGFAVGVDRTLRRGKGKKAKHRPVMPPLIAHFPLNQKPALGKEKISQNNLPVSGSNRPLPVWAARCPVCMLAFHKEYLGIHLRRKHAVGPVAKVTSGLINRALVEKRTTRVAGTTMAAPSIQQSKREGQRVNKKKNKNSGKRRTWAGPKKKQKTKLSSEDMQRIFEAKMSSAGRPGSSRRH